MNTKLKIETLPKGSVYIEETRARDVTHRIESPWFISFSWTETDVTVKVLNMQVGNAKFEDTTIDDAVPTLSTIKEIVDDFKASPEGGITIPSGNVRLLANGGLRFTES